MTGSANEQGLGMRHVHTLAVYMEYLCNRYFSKRTPSNDILHIDMRSLSPKFTSMTPEIFKYFYVSYECRYARTVGDRIGRYLLEVSRRPTSLQVVFGHFRWGKLEATVLALMRCTAMHGGCDVAFTLRSAMAV